MAVIKDLGVATAYGYARSKGYTGTEEEFAELMANYATVADEAQGYANDAADAAALASGYKAAAAASAGEAAASAASADQKATAANQSAVSARESATAAAGSEVQASASAGQASGSAASAGNSAASADESAEKAEAFADGRRNGVDVPSTDPAYQNNAKYYRQRSEAWAKGTVDGTPVGSGDDAFQANSKFYRDEAAESAEDAEAWAQGTRNGVAVLPTDPAYQKSAKYEADQAAASAASAASDAEDVAEALATAQEQYLKAFPQDTVSAPLASFPDGADGIPMLSVKAAFSPAQNLNGYDHPWVGGTGANKLNPNDVAATRGIISGTEAETIFTVTESGNAVYSYNLPLSYASHTFYLSGEITRTGAHTRTTAVQLFAGGNRYTEIGTYADNVAALSDVAVQIPADATAVAIRICANLDGDDKIGEVVTVRNLRLCESTEQAWTPYENVCPISGYTSASVTRMGKNLANVAAAVAYGGSTIQYDASTGVLDVSGDRAHAGARFVLTKLNAGVRYVFSARGQKITGASWRLALQKGSSLTVIGTSPEMAESGDTEFAYTPSESGAYWMLLLANLATPQASEVRFSRVQVEAAASGGATAYEPHVRDTKTANFGSTLYGGEADLVAGSVRITDHCLSLTGDEVVAYSSDTIQIPIVGVLAEVGAEFSSHFAQDDSSSHLWGTFELINDRYISIGNVDPYSVNNRHFADANAFKTWLADQNAAGTPAQIGYTRQMDGSTTFEAAEIMSLLGENNLWSNRGDVTAEYRADVGLYVQKKIAEVLE